MLHQNVELCWYFYQVSICLHNFIFPYLLSNKPFSGASSKDLLNRYLTGVCWSVGGFSLQTCLNVAIIERPVS